MANNSVHEINGAGHSVLCPDKTANLGSFLIDRFVSFHVQDRLSDGFFGHGRATHDA